jgi:hypothetical protein
VTVGQAGTICLLLLTTGAQMRGRLTLADRYRNASIFFLAIANGRLHRTEAMSPDRFMVRATAGLASWAGLWVGAGTTPDT